MAQLTYGSQSFYPALAGQIELSQGARVVTATCSATGNIAFGELVEIDPAAQVELVKASDGVGAAYGVCLRDDTHMQVSGNAQYVPGEVLSIVRQGRVWVKVAVAATLGTAHALMAGSIALKNATAPNGDPIALYEINLA